MKLSAGKLSQRQAGRLPYNSKRASNVPFDETNRIGEGMKIGVNQLRWNWMRGERERSAIRFVLDKNNESTPHLNPLPQGERRTHSLYFHEAKPSLIGGCNYLQS